MKRKKRIFKLIVTMVFLFMLCGCANDGDNDNKNIQTDSVKEKKTTKNVGDYLFNTKQGDGIEISGNDLLQRKKVEKSIDLSANKDSWFSIKRDNYGVGIAMNIYIGNVGVDMVSCLNDSLDENCGAKKDFYYQLSGYDFNNDGKKEIVVAAGNKKDILELYIYQIINEKFDDKNNPKLLKSIKGAIKAYVNQKNEICVINSSGEIETYSCFE